MEIESASLSGYGSSPERHLPLIWERWIVRQPRKIRFHVMDPAGITGPDIHPR